jgi:hypothetical protein
LKLFLALVSIGILRILIAQDNGGASVGSTEAPHLRPGLWEISLDTGHARPMIMEVCVDSSARADWATGLGRFADPKCGTKSVTKTANGVELTASCSLPRGAILATRSIVSGDLSESYTLNTDNLISGSPRGADDGESKSITTGRWSGPCPAGQKPGQGTVVLPDGRRMQLTPR